VGCEVLGGVLKPGYHLFKEERGNVGEIKQIQSQGQNVDEAKIGDKIAVSIVGPVVGRQIDESDVLYTEMTSEEYLKLKKNERFLTEHELAVLEEIKEIKKRHDPRWGL
jgi:translation initiation factor 5B